MLKVGLVGVGGISGAHIPAWKNMEETELAALCDVRQEQMASYPEQRCYTDFDEMLKKEQLDILDICLPTYLHAEYAIKAMKQGIHVICEKPISLHKEDVEKVYRTARENNVKFMVAQVLRFWPEYQLVKDLYDSGRYGKLLSGSMKRLGSIPKWSWDGWMQDEARSGMVPFDLHIHDSDFMIYTFGKPKNIDVHRTKRPDQDYICAIYEYPNFFITAEASWYASPYPFGAEYRFQFEDAVAAWEKGVCKIYEKAGAIIDLTTQSDSDTGHINLPKSNAYANEIRYFTDCVLKDRQPEKVKAEELETVIDILHGLA